MVAIPVAISLAGLGLLPVAASASTQIGQAFSPLPNDCLAGITWLQTGSPDNLYAMPFAGVITSWTHQGGSEPPQLKLKVGRPAGGDQFTIVGESPVKAPGAGLNTYTDVRISVQPGDVLGFYIASAGDCLGPPSGAYASRNRTGDVSPGAPATPFPNAGSFQLDVAATLEPDCDSDGFGDETQDPDTLVCRARSVTLDANKNKVEEGKKVRFSGEVANGPQNAAACAAGQTLEMARKKPSNTTFKPFRQVQTDAQGRFSAKVEVKKTLEYRVEVAESANCARAESNTEKVKAKGK